MLSDPARRELYAFVVGRGGDVGRNEVAAAVGIQRTLAAFHLDRLAEAGLLEVSYRRLSGRSGPGAGRPAKLYRRAARERVVSVPPRDYQRAAAVFAEAVERSGAEPALYAVARARGASDGRRISDQDFQTVMHDLAERGYAPYADAGVVRLRNCPFDTLAREFPVVACGMNLALLEGLLEGAGVADTHQARMEPRAGECCVAIVSKTNVS